MKYFQPKGKKDLAKAYDIQKWPLVHSKLQFQQHFVLKVSFFYDVEHILDKI
jgi:hypothetical protein